MKLFSPFIFLLIFVCFFANNLIAQSDSEGEFLWEISGNGLKQKSYLFGSIFVHDERVFNLTDSIFWALERADLFVSEVNIDSLHLLQDLDELLSEDSENTKRENFDLYLENGKETFLDFYIGVVAKSMKMKVDGLSNPGDYKGSYNSQDTYSLELGSKTYRNWIEAYDSRSIKKVEQLISGDSADGILAEGNRNWMIRIKELLSRGSNFIAVGVAHLVGADGLIALLEREGYEIRRIGKGAQNEIFDQYYQSYEDYDFEKVRLSEFPNISFMQPSYRTYQKLEGNLELHMGAEYLLGANFFAIGGIVKENGKELFFESLPNSYDVKKKEIKVTSGIAPNGYKYEQYEFVGTGFVNRLRFYQFKNLFLVYQVSGFSDSALRQPLVNRLLESVNFEDQDYEWEEESNDEANIDFIFPVSKEYSENSSLFPGFEAHGELTIKYKSHVDPVNGDEYLFRYNSTPPGILYVDYDEAFVSQSNALANRLGGELVDFKYDKNRDYTFLSRIKMPDTSNVFLQSILRGTQYLLWLHKTNDDLPDSSFFNQYSFHPLPQSSEGEYRGLDYTLNYGGRVYARNDSTGSYLNRASISDQGMMSSLELTEIEYAPYEYIDLSRRQFLVDSALFAEEDGLISASQFTLDNGVKGERYIFEYDSMHYIEEEYILYFNGKQCDLTFAVPKEEEGKGVYLDIVKNIQIELDSAKTQEMYLPRNQLFFEHLLSSDSTLFLQAVNGFDIVELDSSDVMNVMRFMRTESLDEDEQYGSKYKMVEAIHDIQELRDSLIYLYDISDEYSTKQRILESLAMRKDSASLNDFIELLKESSDNYYMDQYYYSSFADSIELTKTFIKDIEFLLSENIQRDNFIPIYLDYIIEDSTYNYDAEWLRKIIHEQIETYYDWAISDTSAFVDQYIMDYYLTDTTEDVARDKLYEFLNEKGDLFGKYRVVFNQLSNDKEVEEVNLDTLMQHPYFGYYLYYMADQKKTEKWIDKYRSPEFTQILAARKMFFDHLDVQASGCEIIEASESNKNYSFVSCEGSSSENHYLALAYPLDDKGFLIFDDDASLYFRSERLRENLEEDKLILINEIGN